MLGIGESRVLRVMLAIAIVVQTLMIVYITDRRAYLANLTPLGDVHRKHMGRHYPAMAVVEVQSLIDSKALVEIEAVAVL